MPGENPRCQVGTINPTDMPGGRGQQLRVATIVPRPSRLTTNLANLTTQESPNRDVLLLVILHPHIHTYIQASSTQEQNDIHESGCASD